ncbi:hypothetical protein GGR51DRAFT_566487 [Nemania sp. FL0031]|nr:hypothetical protein GGR51DRAFT_566487 [Nemania sp. FL0031]
MSPNLDLFIVIKRIGSTDGLKHWIPVLYDPDLKQGYWYHLIDVLQSFEMEIKDRSAFEDPEIDQVKYITVLPKENRSKFANICRQTQFDSCQTWVVAILHDLEQSGVAPLGTHQKWSERIDDCRPWP